MIYFPAVSSVNQPGELVVMMTYSEKQHAVWATLDSGWFTVELWNGYICKRGQTVPVQYVLCACRFFVNTSLPKTFSLMFFFQSFKWIKKQFMWQVIQTLIITSCELIHGYNTENCHKVNDTFYYKCTRWITAINQDGEYILRPLIYIKLLTQKTLNQQLAKQCFLFSTWIKMWL